MPTARCAAVKAYLKTAPEPLAVVASDTIYQSIVRHGYDGLDGKEFDPLVNVTVGFRRRKAGCTCPARTGSQSWYRRGPRPPTPPNGRYGERRLRGGQATGRRPCAGLLGRGWSRGAGR